MERVLGYQKIWEGSIDCDVLEDFIVSGQPFYFRYCGNDYLIEADSGYIIVDPFLYYQDGGRSDKFDFAYLYHKEAKTAEEFMKLPFLDGKTIFERFDELRFFDISPIYENTAK